MGPIVARRMPGRGDQGKCMRMIAESVVRMVTYKPLFFAALAERQRKLCKNDYIKNTYPGIKYGK